MHVYSGCRTYPKRIIEGDLFNYGGGNTLSSCLLFPWKNNLVDTKFFSFVSLEKEECSIERVEDNFLELRAEVEGPPDTPYENDWFQFDKTIPENYPFSPPVIRSVTKIWDQNMSFVTGAIYLDALKVCTLSQSIIDYFQVCKLNPCSTMRSVLLSLQALLVYPELDYPQDAVVARQYKKKLKIFNHTAQYWPHVYAGGLHVTLFCFKTNNPTKFVFH